MQARLMRQLGDYSGYAVTTMIYAGVHIFSLNLILALAALVAGAFWGALYIWRRDLLLLIVSHAFWGAFIFAIAPIGQ
jgi:membrane protease YdiL (CAAX protease family)